MITCFSVPKTCPICDGARRISRRRERRWWEVLLQRPSMTEELCERCVGTGVVPASVEEEENARRRQQTFADGLRRDRERWQRQSRWADRRLQDVEAEPMRQQQAVAEQRGDDRFRSWLARQPGYRPGKRRRFECAICAKDESLEGHACGTCNSWYCSQHAIYDLYDGNVGHYLCPYCRTPIR